MSTVITQFIGIDPGVKSGLAIWDAKLGRITFLKSVSFFEALHKLLIFSEECKKENHHFAVIIENPKGISGMYGRHDKYVGNVRTTIAQSVGSNKRDSALIFEFCQLHSFPCYLITPGKHSLTKLSAEEFRSRFKWEGAGDQHARDAAGLVIGYKPMIFRASELQKPPSAARFFPG